MAHVILCSNNCIFLNHILPFVLILFCLFCKPICLPPLRSPCNFIRSYPFAILFEAFPLTTDNFDRTVRRHGKDSVSAFLSFGQKVVIQLSCNTLLSHLRSRQIIHSQFSASLTLHVSQALRKASATYRRRQQSLVWPGCLAFKQLRPNPPDTLIKFRRTMRTLLALCIILSRLPNKCAATVKTAFSERSARQQSDLNNIWR